MNPWLQCNSPAMPINNFGPCAMGPWMAPQTSSYDQKMPKMENWYHNNSKMNFERKFGTNFNPKSAIKDEIKVEPPEIMDIVDSGDEDDSDVIEFIDLT